MEDLFELIFDALFEGLSFMATSPKIPKPLRYISAIFIFLFFAAVIGGLLVLGIILIAEHTFIGWFFLILGISFLIGAILKYKKAVRRRHR